MHFKLPETPVISTRIEVRKVSAAQTSAKPVSSSISEKLEKARMIRSSNLDEDEKAVVLELQFSADAMDRSRLSHSAIAERTGLPIETVGKTLASLEKRGLIRRNASAVTITDELAWRKAGAVE